MSLNDALAYGQNALEQSFIPSARLDARLLLAHSSGLSREAMLLDMKKPLAAPEWDDFKALVARRAAREPLSHIVCRREFWGCHFYVTKDTLDPRPDSETLIEEALKCFPNKAAPLRILDLGTGTGCLLLTLLKEYPNARGTAVDISPAALDVAKINCHNLGLEQRVEFALQCWGKGLSGSYDLIISNPPYIEEGAIAALEPEVALYEPRLALTGGEDGLQCYRELAPDIASLLADDGFSILEFGKGQEHQVAAILATSHLQTISFGSDLSGTVRCITVTSKTNKR